MSLQDVFNEERATVRIPQERPLAEQLRRQGFWVALCSQAVFGPSTDAFLGTGETVEIASRRAEDVESFRSIEPDPDLQFEVLDPIDPDEEARLAWEREQEAEPSSDGQPDPSDLASWQGDWQEAEVDDDGPQEPPEVRFGPSDEIPF